jgi:hypothetical protein
MISDGFSGTKLATLPDRGFICPNINGEHRKNQNRQNFELSALSYELTGRIRPDEGENER